MFRTLRYAIMVLVLGGVGSLSGPVSGLAGAQTVPSCQTRQIAVSLGRSSGAAGTIYHPIVFTNRGATCAMWGVPAVQPVGARRQPVGPPARNASMGEMPLRHVLAHAQSLSVGVGVAETGNWPPALCRARRAIGVVVSLAPFVGAHFVPMSISVCTRLASVSTRLLSPGRAG